MNTMKTGATPGRKSVPLHRVSRLIRTDVRSPSTWVLLGANVSSARFDHSTNEQNYCFSKAGVNTRIPVPSCEFHRTSVRTRMLMRETGKPCPSWGRTSGLTISLAPEISATAVNSIKFFVPTSRHWARLVAIIIPLRNHSLGIYTFCRGIVTSLGIEYTCQDKGFNCHVRSLLFTVLLVAIKSSAGCSVNCSMASNTPACQFEYAFQHIP
jgi:hypothetical protein